MSKGVSLIKESVKFKREYVTKANECEKTSKINSGCQVPIFLIFSANSYFLLFFIKIPIFSYFSANLQLNFSFQGFFQVFFSVWQHMY